MSKEGKLEVNIITSIDDDIDYNKLIGVKTVKNKSTGFDITVEIKNIEEGESVEDMIILDPAKELMKNKEDDVND